MAQPCPSLDAAQDVPCEAVAGHELHGMLGCLERRGVIAEIFGFYMRREHQDPGVIWLGAGATAHGVHQHRPVAAQQADAALKVCKVGVVRVEKFAFADQFERMVEIALIRCQICRPQ